MQSVLSHSKNRYSKRTQPRVSDLAFLNDVLDGLSKSQKSIPSKYFYDKVGSELFDQICDLEEYYPTRTEMSIMQENLDEIVNAVGRDAVLIEYGSGSSLKTRILLEHLEEMAGYVPIDISNTHLQESARQLKRDFPSLDIFPVHADYSTAVKLPEISRPFAKKVVYFPGSTIGNFTPEESVLFLERIAGLCDKGGGLLIGVDMKKDEAILKAAYNDKKGVTAAFNLNLLQRINKELMGDIDLDKFTHEAIYNKEKGRIEMHLISNEDQVVHIAGRTVQFRSGETIHTENSYKYALPEFADLANQAGLNVKKVWTDPHCLFSIQYLETSE